MRFANHWIQFLHSILNEPGLYIKDVDYVLVASLYRSLCLYACYLLALLFLLFPFNLYPQVTGGLVFVNSYLVSLR